MFIMAPAKKLEEFNNPVKGEYCVSNSCTRLTYIQNNKEIWSKEDSVATIMLQVSNLDRAGECIIHE
jgi:hypothetical protein